ncbi:protein diaphanous homolog 1-like [Aethina tumida]|uniref:protein diaphanous homolog 1-like n=1 Tax=Aethina tumida TaxID=116153 RepID=UPI002148F137|nr:protein diaphanous homolog 1-like [Aethina tumida]
MPKKKEIIGAQRDTIAALEAKIVAQNAQIQALFAELRSVKDSIAGQPSAGTLAAAHPPAAAPMPATAPMGTQPPPNPKNSTPAVAPKPAAIPMPATAPKGNQPPPNPKNITPAAVAKPAATPKLATAPKGNQPPPNPKINIPAVSVKPVAPSTSNQPLTSPKPGAPANPSKPAVPPRNDKPVAKKAKVLKPLSWSDSDSEMSVDVPVTPAASRAPPAPVPARKRKNHASSASSTESSDSESNNSRNGAPVEKTVPIHVRDHSVWPALQKKLAGGDIRYRQAKNTSLGVRIIPERVQDHRAITKLLEKRSIPYNTHQLPEDKQLVAIIRGVNQAVSEDQVRSELVNMGLPVVKVHRMRRGENIWPLMSVHLHRTEVAKLIFDVHVVAGLSVTVEAKRKSTVVPQCGRCLKFGHTNNYCFADFVCSFCAHGHISAECRKKSVDGAKPRCANCGGEHRATYRGCPKAPKPKNYPAPKKATPTPRAAKPVAPGVSYAQAATATPHPAPQVVPAPPAAPAPPTTPLTPNNVSLDSIQHFVLVVQPLLAQLATALQPFAAPPHRPSDS